MPTNGSEDVRTVIYGALGGKLRLAGADPRAVDEAANLLEIGIIDSADLLDIILEVETVCRLKFSPETFVLERGVSISTLVNAFVAP